MDKGDFLSNCGNLIVFMICCWVVVNKFIKGFFYVIILRVIKEIVNVNIGVR